jgi:hypothetical protein
LELRAVFPLLEECGARPVVLRNWDGLPDRPEGDVDILVHGAALPAVDRSLQSAGFSRHVTRSDGSLAGALPHEQYRDRQGLLLDLVQRLCYRSPYYTRHPWVAVDPQLTEWTLARRVPHAGGAFHVPSPPDALAHLLCHALFDKREFKPVYRTRLAALAAAQTDAELEPVLSRVFYKVWDQVLAQLRAGAWDDLLHVERLKGY